RDMSAGGRVGDEGDRAVRLVADQPDLHWVVERDRGRELAGDVTRGGGVDVHQVEVPLAYLVGELADGEDLLHARRGVGDGVEGAGEGSELREQRHLELEPQVLP